MNVKRGEQGVYTLVLADGRTQDHEGFDLAGMLTYAARHGAMQLTAPNGHVYDDGDIAISQVGNPFDDDGTDVSEWTV
jgi:hypothetical protein